MNANTYDRPGTTGGNRETLMDDLSILEPEETPLTSLAAKESCSGTFPEVLADTLRAVRITGSKEGTPGKGSNNKAKERERFGNYVHRVFDEWSVTDTQQAVSQRGGTAAIDDEADDAKAKTFREVKRDMEAIACSDQEMQSGGANDMRTRGAFKWLDTSAQSTQPVPANFRPGSGQVLSGVGDPASFTETQFNGVLQAIQRVYGRKQALVGIFGDEVVEVVDNFTRVQPSSTNQRYYVTEPADRKEISLEVKVFDSSFGRVEVVPTQFNKVTAATGAPDHNAGLLLNMDLWCLKFLEDLMSKDEQDEGGGPWGWMRAQFAVLCKNPQGNGKIYNT